MWMWSRFAMQDDFGFDWKKVYGLYSRMCLERMHYLTFYQPQIRNTVEYLVVNCVRIETDFTKQAQIRALVQMSSRLLEIPLSPKT